MSLFQSNSCAAFTWDADHHFTGVLVKRHGHHIVIEDVWRDQKIGNQSAAQLLEKGKRELHIDDDTTVVVGGDADKVCYVDLKMPKIPPEDLRHALYFELSKNTPIPVDEIQWSYRIIGKVDESEMNLLRVVYFPRSEWELWVAAASGIVSGVDIIIPMVAVLDPLLTGTDVCLRQSNGYPNFVFHSEGNGERKIICDSSATSERRIVGTKENPVNFDGVDIGKLESIPSEERRQFTPAVILGAYGVSGDFPRDKKHWLPVPAEMRPRRNQLQKIYITFIMSYLFLIMGWMVASRVYAQYEIYQQLDAEERRIREDIVRLEDANQSSTNADELEIGIRDVTTTMRSLTESLMAITAVTGEQMWSTNFNWDEGEVRLELRADSDESDLTLQFQQSPALSDITMRKRQLSDGSVNYTVNCRVRPDVDPDSLHLQALPRKVEKDPSDSDSGVMEIDDEESMGDDDEIDNESDEIEPDDDETPVNEDNVDEPE